MAGNPMDSLQAELAKRHPVSCRLTIPDSLSFMGRTYILVKDEQRDKEEE